MVPPDNERRRTPRQESRTHFLRVLGYGIAVTVVGGGSCMVMNEQLNQVKRESSYSIDIPHIGMFAGQILLERDGPKNPTVNPLVSLLEPHVRAVEVPWHTIKKINDVNVADAPIIAIYNAPIVGVSSDEAEHYWIKMRATATKLFGEYTVPIYYSVWPILPEEIPYIRLNGTFVNTFETQFHVPENQLGHVSPVYATTLR